MLRWDLLEVFQPAISLETMKHLKSSQPVGWFAVARGIVAAIVLSSCSFGQTPCEPRHASRVPVKRSHAAPAPAVDWTTLPSTYTHDATGQRVDQYAQGIEPETYAQSDFVRSGFTHTRSSLQVGFNSDHYHVTEQWGGQTRPYGEWRFPYRPFSVPYGAWGPQLPQVAAQNVFPWGAWQGGPPQGGPWQGGPWQGGPWQGGGGGGMGPGGVGGGAGAGGGPVPGPGVPPGMPPGGHPGMHPGQGFPQGVPWWGYPGVSPYAPYGGVGPFGVGPANGLSPIQEDYYPQAPIYQQPSDGYFHSPYRPVP